MYLSAQHRPGGKKKWGRCLNLPWADPSSARIQFPAVRPCCPCSQLSSFTAPRQKSLCQQNSSGRWLLNIADNPCAPGWPRPDPDRSVCADPVFLRSWKVSSQEARPWQRLLLLHLSSELWLNDEFCGGFSLLSASQISALWPSRSFLQQEMQETQHMKL